MEEKIKNSAGEMASEGVERGLGAQRRNIPRKKSGRAHK